MTNPQLEQLLQLPHVWQASRGKRINSVLSTGYSLLDEQLHHGGWPDNATTELLLPYFGLGELRLLIPGLRQVQRGRPWLVFIDPPFMPYAPAFAQRGINPAGILVIKPRSPKDLLWCAENTLRSGCCGAVLCWATGLTLNTQQLRRLQRAAHRGQCWHVLFRHLKTGRQSSASALRLQLRCNTDGLLQLQVLKQRGGWSGQQLVLHLQPDFTAWRQLAPQQWPLPHKQRGSTTPAVPQPNNVIVFPGNN